MKLARVVLVLVDISGYTRFIVDRSLALAHAETIVTTLVEAVVARSRRPLRLNKLQGDAALLFAALGAAEGEAAKDAFAQVRGFFESFVQARQRLIEQRGNCGCEACSNIAALELKAFLHCGEIAIKRVSGREELAGEPVILLHRLLKNSLSERCYVLASRDVVTLAALNLAGWRAHNETVDDFGLQELMLAAPEALPDAPLHERAGPLAWLRRLLRP